ncbi:hypothetical protein Ssi03_77090 [Sphaerisporangium siamense]|uniref:Uncharacterized protein n=1 Tax=Sphaerisporangium siamense TaxID=795645 RepID=A0A7W7DBD1_9ACTN|nr:hypothetical protein [Sphaerisporangium siamense]MBB4702273.1 hypothetical protein [Sphaerisporangium siamense]GII89719.1 hypothetical protein Ssi03_77090 [Sphaerisporangium siamense]
MELGRGRQEAELPGAGVVLDLELQAAAASDLTVVGVSGAGAPSR